MISMFRLARLAPVVVVAVLCLFVALRYAIAQTTPAAPTIDSVTPGDTSLTVAWTAPAGETGIIAYDVRHIETSADETDDANWTEVDNAWTSGALQHTITMLTNGTQYDVQVRAVNANGDGTWSDTTVGTPALPAPTISSVRADDRALFVTWTPPPGITRHAADYDVRYIATSSDETVDANWTVGGRRLEFRRRQLWLRHHRPGQRHGVRRAGARGGRQRHRRRLVDHRQLDARGPRRRPGYSYKRNA